MTEQPFVIVGAGLAGAKAAEALRAQGYTGELVLLDGESHLPYERPPLSKGYLAGKSDRDGMTVHPADWYTEHNVDLRRDITATAIDPGAHTVTLSDGSTLGYAKLVLATGSRPRQLPLPGADAEGVLTLRNVEDSDQIRQTIASAKRLAVIGAGWIGLEVTAAAREAGVAVTVLESLELPLLRVLGPELGKVFADLHADHEVDLRFGASVAEIAVENGRAVGVKLADGSTVPADAVLVAVGAVPNVELAQQAGLDVDNGVLVNASLRTSDPDVFAVGDIAAQAHPVLNRRVRVEHWANALNQPAVAATAMVGGEASYDALPYFFTDQYDLGMEYVGIAEPGDYDQVVFRGDVGKREFVAFWLSGGKVLAGMNVNIWDVTDEVKALIRAGRTVDPARLSDPSVPLGEV